MSGILIFPSASEAVHAGFEILSIYVDERRANRSVFIEYRSPVTPADVNLPAPMIDEEADFRPMRSRSSLN